MGFYSLSPVKFISEIAITYIYNELMSEVKKTKLHRAVQLTLGLFQTFA